ncbi:MFS transporter [Bacillus sp. HMF5848]|uniref:MFS transporter n=1 Tax=Bacillus sp. HMF5848 TaxID=2495421 RepID=UPI000F78E6BA|nr:MFS transporter [Bacillus sp. HMF5848]RSK28409.1 MFS transporter [Bacillus sp. HMF5848]
MWIANFLVAASATMVLPFLSLFIEQLGSFSASYVQRWSGLTFGVTFIAALIVSPLWGRMGDRYGYKRVLLITGFGISISIFCMSFVQTVEQLFVLRLVMGCVTGFIPTSLALISSMAPKDIVGKTLGTLQTGTVSGSLFGPMLGGLLADSTGFSITFLITSIAIAFATFIVLVGVKELKKPKVEGSSAKRYDRKAVWRYILHHPILFSLMFISLLTQAAIFSIQPLLALYVSDMLPAATNVAFISGTVFSAAGLGNLLSTRRWGKLGDSIGFHKVIFILLILGAVFFIPQAFVTEIWQLAFWRFLVGLSIGGIIPCLTAYVRQLSPLESQGEILGYTVSFRFLGNVVGPILGGVVSGYLGIHFVFFITSTLLLICAIILWTSKQKASTVNEKHSAFFQNS